MGRADHLAVHQDGEVVVDGPQFHPDPFIGTVGARQRPFSKPHATRSRRGEASLAGGQMHDESGLRGGNIIRAQA